MARAAQIQKKSFAEVAAGGDELETLRALRAKIAETIDATKSGRDIAALSRQMMLIAARIKELEDARQDDEASAVLDRIRLRTVQGGAGEAASG